MARKQATHKNNLGNFEASRSSAWSCSPGCTCHSSSPTANAPYTTHLEQVSSRPRLPCTLHLLEQLVKNLPAEATIENKAKEELSKKHQTQKKIIQKSQKKKQSLLSPSAAHIDGVLGLGRLVSKRTKRGSFSVYFEGLSRLSWNVHRNLSQFQKF